MFVETSGESSEDSNHAYRVKSESPHMQTNMITILEKVALLCYLIHIYTLSGHTGRARGSCAADCSLLQSKLLSTDGREYRPFELIGGIVC
jgi:hypothetical protein